VVEASGVDRVARVAVRGGPLHFMDCEPCTIRVLVCATVVTGRSSAGARRRYCFLAGDRLERRPDRAALSRHRTALVRSGSKRQLCRRQWPGSRDIRQPRAECLHVAQNASQHGPGILAFSQRKGYKASQGAVAAFSHQRITPKLRTGIALVSTRRAGLRALRPKRNSKCLIPTS